ncbi:Homeodomain protein [Pseudocohnilembus persalinus]|uniref:Homeodomain protein n=1 Tax=Pseudocohnilembus persalinus TaxID=266149 RepID=A0A0V0QS39_PSEPJ|nr:Homeodomain protein [Pseudocohnilembus persalinus]|eukprot:KRX04824.1 Homeodomain protein [Pseudocohnilembus persalinus]
MANQLKRLDKESLTNLDIGDDIQNQIVRKEQQINPIQNFLDQDWEYIGKITPGKNSELCKFKWLSLKKLSIQQQPWTKQEDNILLDLVAEKGKSNWSEVAKQLYLRSDTKIFRQSKKCRERYNNHLDPSIKKGAWNKKEDKLLLKLTKNSGNKWAEIAKLIKGRTENAVKNRFNAIQKKKQQYPGKENQISDDDNIYEEDEDLYLDEINENEEENQKENNSQGKNSYQGSNQNESYTNPDLTGTPTIRSPQISGLSYSSNNKMKQIEKKLSQLPSIFQKDSIQIKKAQDDFQYNSNIQNNKDSSETDIRRHSQSYTVKKNQGHNFNLEQTEYCLNLGNDENNNINNLNWQQLQYQQNENGGKYIHRELKLQY